MSSICRAIVLVLLVSSLFVLPSNAWADKGAIAFDALTNIEVLEVYDTAYATQKTVAKSLKLNGKAMRKEAGFKGFAVFKSRDGKRVIALSQWQDLASYPGSATSSDASQPAPALPTRSLTFELVKSQPFIESATPAIRGKEATVQLIEFVPKSGEAEALISQVEALMPKVMSTQPIPQSATLMKAEGSIDLLINWNCSAMFEDLGKPMPIELGSITELAEADQQFYEVTQIVAAEVKEAKSEVSQ
jgi:quinol monooxygenase YgiN